MENKLTRKEVVEKVRKSINCLRLELPQEVVNEVSRIVEETINWYDEKLEISYAFDQTGIPISIPDEDRNKYPDGIECRDETIRLIENSNNNLVLRKEILEKALRFYADPHIYGISGGSSDKIMQDAGKVAKKALKIQKEVYHVRT